MKTQVSNFTTIVDSIYSLPMEDKLELKSLLDLNIAELNRDKIAQNFKSALEEQKNGSLSFSANLSTLKKMLDGDSI